MPQKMITKGLFSGLPGVCYGPGVPPDADHTFDVVFDTFFAEQEERPLKEGIDADLSEWGVPDQLLLWTLCRATIVDSFVLRQFSSDCLEFAAPYIFANESYDVSMLPLGEHPSIESFVGEVVHCARSYATADCDHEMMVGTQQKVVDLMVMDNLEECHAHFLNVCRHVLDPHPDGGAIQCVMNITRCFDQMEEDSVVLGAWMKAAFRRRCQEAGFFNET